MDKVFSRSAQLPHLPEVALELIQATTSESVNIRQVVAVVAKDQAVAAKVLRLANSAFYGHSGKVSSLEQAVRLVGLADFRSMVLTASVISSFGAVEGIDLRKHWAHGTLTGFAASSIAEERGMDRGVAFSAGLLHSMGALLMHLTIPEIAKGVAARIPGLDFVARAAVERETLGFSHAEVGREMLKRWRFPSEVYEAVAAYPRSNGDEAIPSAVFCATVGATGALGGLAEEEVNERVGQQTLNLLQLPSSWYADHVQNQVEGARSVAGALA